MAIESAPESMFQSWFVCYESLTKRQVVVSHPFTLSDFSFFFKDEKNKWKIQLYSSTIWICFIRTLQVLILKWLHFWILKLVACCQKYTNLVSTGGMEIVHIINHRYYCYERIRDPSRIGSRADTCWYIHVILN